MDTKTRDQVALDVIDDNPWQPREAIDPDSLEELADSIRQIGLLQTPLARPSAAGRFELAFGHRRIAAVRLLQQREEWGDYVNLVSAQMSEQRSRGLAVEVLMLAATSGCGEVQQPCRGSDTRWS